MRGSLIGSSPNRKTTVTGREGDVFVAVVSGQVSVPPQQARRRKEKWYRLPLDRLNIQETSLVLCVRKQGLSTL